MKLPIDRGAASPMASNNSRDAWPAVPNAKAVFARSWELKRSPCVKAVSAMESKSSGAWTSAAAKAQATLALRVG